MAEYKERKRSDSGNYVRWQGRHTTSGSIDATPEQARKNIAQLVRDLASGRYPLEGVHYRRDYGRDRPEWGVYAYCLRRDQRSLEVLMPGLPIEYVRMEKNCNDLRKYSKLRVDGGGWVWIYAVPIIKEELRKKGRKRD